MASMTRRVLFVCLGNICRSPAAEGVFRDMARTAGLDVETDSAGTSNWHTGAPPYEPMRRTAAQRGYDLSDLRARQFNVRDFQDFDLIVGMDDENMADIERLRPQGATAEARRMTDFAPQAGAGHVPDPYYTGDYDGALDLVEECARGLVKALSQG